jgi:hypothetical protein
MKRHREMSANQSNDCDHDWRVMPRLSLMRVPLADGWSSWTKVEGSEIRETRKRTTICRRCVLKQDQVEERNVADDWKRVDEESTIERAKREVAEAVRDGLLGPDRVALDPRRPRVPEPERW